MEAEQKKILKPLVLEFRHLLEGRYDEHGNWHGGDLEERMNALGVWWDREPVPAGEVPFRSPEDRHARAVIDAYLALREEAGIARRDAIEEFVRETAYTWANRLLVLRCMEARDLIDGVVATKEVYGGRSLAHHRLAQRHPEVCTGEDGGLFAMLQDAFSFHAKHLPLLFDPKAAGVALRPSVAALKRCIALLSGTEAVNNSGTATDEVFAAPDALGWAYQYWNTEEKDRVFEKVRTKKAKIAGADIIPATQLYTEPYMVKFLVQNSLGATWMGMYPDSDLSGGWEYYVKDADRAPVRRKNVENITFLDPACGSGHFLIEAFDLFYQMYEAEGKYTDPETICKKILARNLYGIDIDERAVQIARAALWMKAAERVFDFSGTPKNIIATNIRLPKGKDHLQAFLAKHPEDAPLAPALESIFEGLAHADELGSLLQIEEPVERALRSLRTRLGGQTTLSTGEFAAPTTDEEWETWKDGVVERLADHFTAEAEVADLVNAFFSQNAGKGVRLFELLSKRYDVVAANPPYMGSGTMSLVVKKYLDTNYDKGKRDLFAAFILRNLKLSKLSGKVAMVTQQSWLFLQSYENLRAITEKRTESAQKEEFSGLIRQTSIETIAQLGPKAFGEIGGEVVSVVLFTLTNSGPKENHHLTATRAIAGGCSEKKAELLRNRGNNQTYRILQKLFLHIPFYSLIYWLPEPLLLHLSTSNRLSHQITTSEGLGTRNDSRFVRYQWEAVIDNNRWFMYSKGGGYSRWMGFNYWIVDYNYKGTKIKSQISEKYPYLKGNTDWLVRNEELYFADGLTYSDISNGAFSARYLLKNSIFSDTGPGVFITRTQLNTLGIYFNTYLVTILLRAISPNLHFKTGYVKQLPICPNETALDNKLSKLICYCKSEDVEQDLRDVKFNPSSTLNSYWAYYHLDAILHTIEGFNETKLLGVLDLQNIKDQIYTETGLPSGWHPLIAAYDALPPLPDGLPEIPQEVLDDLTEHERRNLSPNDLATLKANLRTLYEGGPGAKIEIEDDSTSGDGEEEAVAGAYIPIPAETFLEELSQKLQVHPISVYWLLKEGIEEECWRCIPEERRITEDRFTVMVLRMLGHRWPKQIEAGEAVPDWADADGIIPLTPGSGEATLLERVRGRIAAEFPGGSAAAIEREFEEVMGKSLEDWLHTEFFKHHTQQFKKRPIAWQVQSGKFTKKRQPAFACLAYYHKLDEDTLHKIKNQYVGPLRQRYETEMRGIEGIPPASRTEVQERRFRELDGLIAELKTFGATLSDVAENGFSSKTLEKIAKSEPLDSWCSIDGTRPAPADREAFLRQERSYIPDINDGVRVNVVPLQKAGLLAADVIAKKDLEKAVSDRAEWRSDERRWCREGKLPKCGWW
ncbi:hypothetical protein Metli_1322 [Methanofollis liminatans DSM 4140]|uniref:site-specific DNA-methyltransferase (adenine-specific) n=1 Tax=Methanofollis liminatans DSM 4140 TaxID=28892 RepID=J1L2I7_9EURY|nr:BREX-1 system adenine-specific DNA-methyltransferase PglX [Methanofollis liminatans]EJG07277.1 hypothetical protein Metli_1322 [Methanofollis liminatans DSM 4140]